MKISKIDRRYNMHDLAKFSLRFDESTEFHAMIAKLKVAYPGGTRVTYALGDPHTSRRGPRYWEWGDKCDFIYLTTEAQVTYVSLL